MRILHAGIIFFIGTFLNSCEPKVQPEKNIQHDSIAETDSAILLHKLLKSVTDTLPEFLHAELSPGTDADSSNNFCGLYISKGNSITSFYLNDTVNSVSVSYSPNGNLMTVYRSYEQNEFCRIKNYTNGKLMSEGLFVSDDVGMHAMSCPGVPIGKWVFYSPVGKDSIVDHDNDFEINFQEAKQIAEKHGWNASEIHIRFHNDVLMKGDKVEKVNGEEVRTDYWEIIYTGKNNPNSTSVLQINVYTGEEKFVKTPTVVLCT